VTRSGKPFAPHERVSAYDAMRSLTINAAYQYKEEKTKGTLEVGKLADLVVLDRNPLKVHPMSIKDIQVVQTLKEGVLVYNRKPDATAMVAPGFRAGQIDQHVLKRPHIPVRFDQRMTNGVGCGIGCLWEWSPGCEWCGRRHEGATSG
jgi:adenine deaminase